MPRDKETPHRWTFLTNHAMVLVAVARDAGIRMRDIAAQVGITERAAQRIVAELVQEGYVQRIRVGRRNQYQVDSAQPLRHAEAAHTDVGALLGMLARRDPQEMGVNGESAERTISIT